MRGYRDPGLAGGVLALLSEARDRARAGERVVWLTLPSLRDYFLERLAERGPLLGVEVLHFQALYQRVATAWDPPPGMIGTGERVARVAEILYQRGWLKSPGEARLFARAIAELKRFGVSPEAVPRVDRETRRLAEVYRAYEEDRGGLFDPDDLAWEAVRRVEAGSAVPGADALFAGGFLELAPREVRFLRAVGRTQPVAVALPEDPGLGLKPLPPLPARRTHWVAENPVHELRFVLAEIKADLLERGYSPRELAVVAPEGRIPELLLLAREYGVPLANEAYRALAETEDGRRLFELLAFAERPTGERLFLFPGFEELARRAVALGLAGREAILRLAEELGQAEALRALFDRFQPGEDPLAWAEAFLESDPVLRNSPLRPAFEERAREAYRAGGGRDFVKWWASLLERVRAKEREPAGVALLTPDAAAGRRYRKAYLVYAASGAYGVGEREGYFFPEELRLTWPALFGEARAGLPRRIRGRDARLFAVLGSLAEALVVSYPATEGGQPVRPEPGLVTEEPRPMPPPRRASAFGYRPRPPRIETYPPLPAPRSLGELERWAQFGRCGFKAYLDRLGIHPPHGPWEDEGWRRLWRLLARAKREGAPLPEEARATLQMREEEWSRMGFGNRVAIPGFPVAAVVHAMEKRGRVFRVYRFDDEPAEKPAEARKRFSGHLSEVLAAAALAEKGASEVWLWGLGGRPVRAWQLDLSHPRIQTLVASRRARAEELLAAWQEADASPRPGWHCRTCPYADLCRRA